MLDTFTVITTDANHEVKKLHDRMPAEDYGLWLSRETHPELVHRLLVPYDSARIRVHPVSKRVGNARNEGSDLVEEQRETDAPS